MFDPFSLVNIILTSYSSFVTLVVLSLVIYIWRLRKRPICKKCSEDEKKIENLQKLNRTIVDNNYGVDSVSQQSKVLLRAQSVPMSPNRARLVSEYDPIASTSKSHGSSPSPDVNQEDFHYYEEVKTTSKSQHYETILDQVVTTLCTIYTDATEEDDMYERFLRELIKKVKSKSPELYQSIKNYRPVSHHEYEKIKEHNKSSGEKNEFFSEDHAYGMKSLDNLKNKTTFGSNDHLKYLMENKSENSNKDTAYLEAKVFTATPDCPPKLRELCQNQESKSESQTVNVPISGNNKHSDITEYNVSSPMWIRLTSSNDNNNESRSRLPRPPNTAISMLPQRVDKALKLALHPKNYRTLSDSNSDKDVF